jgi:hypothetical protein
VKFLGKIGNTEKRGRLKQGDDKISSKNIKGKKNKKMEKIKLGAIGSSIF